MVAISPQTLDKSRLMGEKNELEFEVLTPIRKNNRGISGVERLRTPVAGILIVGLQLH